LKETINGVEYEYEIYKLVDQFDDVLHTVTPQFDFANPPVDPKVLAISLVKTMMKHGGVGLAAPQCGLPYRVFVMGAPNGAGFACFNPKVISTVGEIGFEEGCLSFKGLYLNIKRPEKVEVEFTDWNGQIVRETFDGLTARTYQHELDHLNGVVYTSLVGQYVLQKAKAKVKTNLKKLERQRLNFQKQQIINQAMQKVMEDRRIEELNKSINISIPDINVNLPIGG